MGAAARVETRYRREAGRYRTDRSRRSCWMRSSIERISPKSSAWGTHWGWRREQSLHSRAGSARPGGGPGSRLDRVDRRSGSYGPESRSRSMDGSAWFGPLLRYSAFSLTAMLVTDVLLDLAA